MRACVRARACVRLSERVRVLVSLSLLGPFVRGSAATGRRRPLQVVNGLVSETTVRVELGAIGKSIEEARASRRTID